MSAVRDSLEDTQRRQASGRTAPNTTPAGRRLQPTERGSTMKKIVLTAAMLFAATGAEAADIARAPAPATPSSYVVSAFDGLYVGGNVGYGFSTFDVNASDPLGSVSATQSASGFLGGVQLGYNKTFGPMLLGLETDYQLSGISKTTNGIETSLPWFGTTRVRAGYLMSPNFLFYGTGGVAYSSAKISDAGYSINVPGVGWVGGAGVEYAMGAGWSIGAEYLHVNLGGPSASVGVINGNAATSADADIGRAKINYKF
jgi:outer membrane immunogenic protein